MRIADGHMVFVPHISKGSSMLPVCKKHERIDKVILSRV